MACRRTLRAVRDREARDVLRPARRTQARVRRDRRRAGLAASRRGGQRLLRGHRDPAGPEGVVRGRADHKTGDPGGRRVLVPPTTCGRPRCRSLETPSSDYLARMRELADELLRVCAAALGLEDDFFTRHTGHATHTLNINWYPPLAQVGDAGPGQFRIGPHTDFGTVTILDREPGAGRPAGVDATQDGWEDAPCEPGALTINTGDLLARWSGGRWRSNRHRVLPPQAEAPDEELVSLVYFYEADHDTVVELAPAADGPHRRTTARSCRRSSSRSGWTRSPSAERARLRARVVIRCVLSGRCEGASAVLGGPGAGARGVGDEVGELRVVRRGRGRSSRARGPRARRGARRRTVSPGSPRCPGSRGGAPRRTRPAPAPRC